MKKNKTTFAFAALALTTVSAVVAVGAWYFWSRKETGSVSDDDVREVEAFEEYERQKTG